MRQRVGSCIGTAFLNVRDAASRFERVVRDMMPGVRIEENQTDLIRGRRFPVHSEVGEGNDFQKPSRYLAGNPS